MKRNVMRFVLILRWITLIALVIVSVVFLIYCLLHSDRRLFPAIICVLGTAAILSKEIYVCRKIRR